MVCDTFSLVALLAAAVILVFVFCRSKSPPLEGFSCGQKQASKMISLWLDHAFLTRTVLVYTFADITDSGDALRRLLRNQVDLGANLALKAGHAAGQAYAELLTEHILIADEIAGAAKAGKDTALLVSKWEKNGSQ